jgi:hypothetical protein
LHPSLLSLKPLETLLGFCLHIRKQLFNFNVFVAKVSTEPLISKEGLTKSKNFSGSLLHCERTRMQGGEASPRSLKAENIFF